MTHLTVGVLLLAEESRGPDYGKASPVGLLVVVLLLLGVFGLVWSMNRHLKRVPASFDNLEAGGGVDGAAVERPEADGVPDPEVPPREQAG